MGEKFLQFIRQGMLLFAFQVFFLMCMVLFFGEEPGLPQISSIYQLGSGGLASETLWQFLFTAVVITALNRFFFEGKWIRKVRLVWRILLMLFSILAFIFGCILVFDWFPAGNLLAWGSFLLVFLLCFAGSSAVVLLKTRRQDRKYEAQLQHYRERHGGDGEETQPSLQQPSSKE